MRDISLKHKQNCNTVDDLRCAYSSLAKQPSLLICATITHPLPASTCNKSKHKHINIINGTSQPKLKGKPISVKRMTVISLKLKSHGAARE